MNKFISLAFAAATVAAASFFAFAPAQAKGVCSGPCVEATVTCGNATVLTKAGGVGTILQACNNGGARAVVRQYEARQDYTPAAAPVYKPTKFTGSAPVVQVKATAGNTSSLGNIPTNVTCGHDFNAGDVVVEFGSCPNGGSATFAPISQATLKMALSRGLAVVQYSNEKKGCYYFKKAVAVGPNHYKVESNRGILLKSGSYSTSETAIAVGMGDACAHTVYGTAYMFRVNSVEQALAIAGK